MTTERERSLSASLGLVVQLVRTSACHAEGRGFESLPVRHEKSAPQGAAFLILADWKG